MSGILDLIRGLDQIKEFEDSQDELNLRTDKLVGTMSEDLKQLYALLQRARREAISARMKMPTLGKRLSGDRSQKGISNCRIADRQKANLGWRDDYPSRGERRGRRVPGASLSELN